MTAIHLLPTVKQPRACTDLIQMIRAGMVQRLKNFVVEPYDDGLTWGIQTVAIAVPDRKYGDDFPVVIVDLHEDDKEAMRYSLAVFEALKEAGRATTTQVAKWRRSLFTLVPKE
ncbi:hypothetical protein [Pseudomonas sp. 2FE]|uniref:hypothetical protein n=1 Tax=Pseudomonas sp. 2FE TaxID=2502190 RepID=UPI0010F5AB53|nr:hypothetical protein [Pseudomonas sp. 2FE]